MKTRLSLYGFDHLLSWFPLKAQLRKQQSTGPKVKATSLQSAHGLDSDVVLTTTLRTFVFLLCKQTTMMKLGPKPLGSFVCVTHVVDADAAPGTRNILTFFIRATSEVCWRRPEEHVSAACRLQLNPSLTQRGLFFIFYRHLPALWAMMLLTCTPSATLQARRHSSCSLLCFGS